MGHYFTPVKVFNSVKFIYDHIEGKSLSDMVPQFGVWFEEMEPRQKCMERTKRLVVFIKGQWDFEVISWIFGTLHEVVYR